MGRRAKSPKRVLKGGRIVQGVIRGKIPNKSSKRGRIVRSGVDHLWLLV